MKTAIILALGATILSTPAFASHHPTQAANEIIDEAAQPAYPIETVAPLRHGWYHHRHSSVGALSRSRSRLTRASRHLVKRPRPAEEATVSAHNSPVVRHEAEAPKVAPGPSVSDVGLAQAALLGRILDLPGPYEDGLTTSAPIIIHTPSRLLGTLTIGDASFRFGSGGDGFWSVPSGSYPVTPESVGDWGRRHDAIGLNDDSIYDRRLRRDREGIELHRDVNGRLTTAGCVAVREWDKFKHSLLAMINQFGHVYLNVSPYGAEISPARDPILMVADIGGAVEAEHHAARRRIHYAHHWTHRHYASR